MRKYGFFLLFCSLFFTQLTAQQSIEWDELADIEYSYEYSEAFKTWYSRPTFGESVQKLSGTQIEIKGFILPLDVAGDYYILSAFPYASCFFCGGAGQESVIELRFKRKKGNFKMDEIVTFKGKLVLNDLPLEMSYVLDEAELVRKN